MNRRSFIGRVVAAVGAALGVPVAAPVVRRRPETVWLGELPGVSFLKCDDWIQMDRAFQTHMDGVDRYLALCGCKPITPPEARPNETPHNS